MDLGLRNKLVLVTGGAKGIGESPINIAPSAIANAVADAIDAPVMQLPITPERVLEALETNLCG